MKRMTTKLGAILFGCLMTVSAWGQAVLPSTTLTLPTTAEELNGMGFSNKSDVSFAIEGDYVVFPAYQLYSSNNQTWTAENGSGSSTREWTTAETPFKGSSYWHTTTDAKTATTKSSRIYCYRVANCMEVKVLGKPQSDRPIIISAYEVTDGVMAGSAALTVTSTADKEVAVTTLGLDYTKEYVVGVNSNQDNSNVDFYEIAFKAAAPCTSAEFVFASNEVSFNESDASIVLPALTNTNNLIGLVYESSNTNVVTVDASTGALTKVGAGEATITVTAPRQVVNAVDYCEAVATCKVTILSNTAHMESTLNDIDLLLGMYDKQKSAVFTISGYNLTGDVSVAVPEGFTLEPATFMVADGAVEQEYTLTYAATEAVSETSANLVFTVGETVVTIPVTYGKIMPTALVPVSEATTWDFSKTGETTVQFTDLTSPSKSDTVNLADIFASPDAFFNAAAMVMVGEYAVRDGAYNQGGYLKFNVAKPGTVKVEFSNTGNRSTAEEIRYLTVNGTVSTFGAQLSSETVTSDPIEIEAGDVELTGTLAKDQSAQYLRFYKVIYTPNEGDPTGLAENAVLSVYFADNTLFNPENVMLYVYNAAGQMVMSGNADLDMTAQPAGLYIVRSAEGAFKIVK